MRAVFTGFLMAALVACGGGSDSPVQPVMVSVGGTLAGLGAGKSVVIGDASGPSAALSANGNYSLTLPLGTAYSLRVLGQPAGQTCAVSNGTGTASADVATVGVACLDDAAAPGSRIITGTVSGLGAGKTLVLQLDAQGVTQETTVNADGSFRFAQPVAGPYTVTVKTAPTGQACTVASLEPITVTCASAASSFKLSGTLSGNAGVVALRNTGNGDTVTLNTNGSFSFTQPVPAGGSYNVTVFDQSAGQACSVANGSGVAGADVTSIQASCAAVVVAVPPAPVVVPAVPTGLTMTYGVKSFNIAWGAVIAPVGGGSVTYRLLEDADGAGPAASTQIGGTLTGATFTQVVSGLLHTRLNAQYTLQACNNDGCSAQTAAITPNLPHAIGYFKASNTGAGDQFGRAVALSGDGSTLAVGAYRDDSAATGTYAVTPGDGAGAADSGAVYVYIRVGGVWTQQAYVKASNTEAGDGFGTSVALSGDGSTLAVGAFGEASAATGTHVVIPGDGAGAVDSGAVYVYSRAGGVWTQQAYVKASNTGGGDIFGISVALSGDGSTLAVGAYGEDSAATGTHVVTPGDGVGATQSGAVYVYTQAGGIWTHQAYVKASNTGANDEFGRNVALSGDGSTLAVGAHNEDSAATGTHVVTPGDGVGASTSGVVYVYARSGGTWTHQAYVKASNTGGADAFGLALALSGDGNTLAVGSVNEDGAATGTHVVTPGDGAGATNSGAVYVYARTGGTWTQQAYVKASDTATGDNFGNSVALTGDGSTLAVGAPVEGSAATASGAVYLFTRAGGIWTQQAYVKAPNPGASDFFGFPVALSGDGNTLAAGAWGEASAATGINGNQADNGAAAAGAAYLY